MATKKIANWVKQLGPDALPESVKDATIRSFTNYIGCAIGGYDHSATEKLIQAYKPLSQASGTCSVLGGEETVDPLQAALVNSFASHLHDFDDTHLATVIHPTTAVASALLAYADMTSGQGGTVSGQDFICALVAGIEVECILGMAVYPSHYDLGWHITATVGSIGAAIAVGKAMKLSSDALVNAIGIAATQVSGMRRHFGSHAKPLGVAFAAQGGLQSAILAQNGMTAANDALEGKRGWIECVCPQQDKGKKDLSSYLERLSAGEGLDGDEKWEVEKNTFKPFSCGIVIHPAIDGCSQLRDGGLDAAEIKSMEIFVHPHVLELTRKQFPKDGLEAKFSVYHGAACGLLFGMAGPAQYTDEIVQETAALREKITATVDRSIKADECRITVHTSQGTVEKHVGHAVGSLAKPMTTDQLRRKFLEQVEPVKGADSARQLFEKLASIMNADNVSDFVKK